MSILRLEHVRREVGTFVILDDVTAAVAHGDRIGLVGANGAGKTTLLRIAAGLDEPDAGVAARKRGLRVGLLAQETNLDAIVIAAPNLRAAVRQGAAEVESLERELASIEASGAEGVSSARYADVRHRFEVLDGYHLDQRVEETLSGLGFARADWDRPPVELSGGEQTRAALARLVVSDPDLLMLDEPTNHLDLAALEWLEQALARRSHALLVASHDRAFLDAVVDRIWELRDRRLEAFRGGYSAYAVQAQERDARLRREAEGRVDSAAREAELVQRYRSHRNYSKMHEHERRLAAIRPMDTPRAAPRLSLPRSALLGRGPVRSGELVVSVRDALVGFPLAEGARGRDAGNGPAGIPILRVPRLEARRGGRIGIVGPNGSGKTTLLRTIAGELFPIDGVVRVGTNVQLGYLAQLREAAFPGATVIDTLLETARVTPGEARGYLARFLFRGDDVFKPVSELSGGERSRLELALLGITEANLLLLDEPTNHLDIPAREALDAFLRESPATLLVVSHDRRLLQGACETLWVVEAGRDGAPGSAVAFDGGYAEWRSAVASGWTVADALELESRRLERGHAPRPGGTPRTPAPRGGGNGARSARDEMPGAQHATAERPRLSKDAYRRRSAAVEADLQRLTERRNALNAALADPIVLASFVELGRVTSELADIEGALAAAEEAWLAVEERAPEGAWVGAPLAPTRGHAG
jgi:ATP-binding cassette, subfamily F, member 3